jgi:hypothetical protein
MEPIAHTELEKEQFCLCYLIMLLPKSTTPQSLYVINL